MDIFDPEAKSSYVKIPEHYETKIDPATGRTIKRFVSPRYTNELTQEAQEKLDVLPADGEPYYGGYLSAIPRYARFIEGLNIPIPWPEADPVQKIDNDVDTLRIEVESQTFMPSLEQAPMPMSVIDEIRNKYSRTRTRHDQEYLEKKGEDLAFQEWQSKRRLVTPEKLKLDKMKEEAERRAEEMARRDLKDKELLELGEMMKQAMISKTTYNMAKAKGRQAQALS
jgi:hypothetical protein